MGFWNGKPLPRARQSDVRIDGCCARGFAPRRTAREVDRPAELGRAFARQLQELTIRDPRHRTATGRDNPRSAPEPGRRAGTMREIEVQDPSTSTCHESRKRYTPWLTRCPAFQPVVGTQPTVLNAKRSLTCVSVAGSSCVGILRWTDEHSETCCERDPSMGPSRSGNGYRTRDVSEADPLGAHGVGVAGSTANSALTRSLRHNGGTCQSANASVMGHLHRRPSEAPPEILLSAVDFFGNSPCRNPTCEEVECVLRR